MGQICFVICADLTPFSEVASTLSIKGQPANLTVTALGP